METIVIALGLLAVGFGIGRLRSLKFFQKKPAH